MDVPVHCIHARHRAAAGRQREAVARLAAAGEGRDMSTAVQRRETSAPTGEPAPPPWYATDLAARLSSYVFGLLLWIVLAMAFERVPGPDEVVVRLVQEFQLGQVFGHFGTTMFRFGLGLLVAAVGGIAIGVLMGLSPISRAFFESPVLVGLSIPAIIWAFLTVMWFGFGWKAPVTTVALSALPFVAVNVAKGVLGVSRDLRDMSRAYGVSRARRIRELVLPAVTGYIIAGVRFAVIIGWNAVLLSEWFGATDGVGFRSRYWYDANRFGGFAAWVVLFVVFIVILDRVILERASRRAFRWRDES
ncbi:MAG: ABC transporter permease subunit [Nitriliruptorales bacterium]|nr:ABC transporter permease subunit [Nitriliruptorales bacterium]